MKHLLSALFALAVLTVTSQADRDDHRHHEWKKSDRHHHHHSHPHRILHAAHYEWHHGHRIYVPARVTVVFY